MALAAAAPAAAAVTGTRIFPAVSSKGVTEAPASSAGAASAAVPAAAPATGGTVFPTASVGGVARASASADGTAALTVAPATGGTVSSAASVEGAPAATSVEKSAAELATSGTVPSAAPTRGAVGARKSSARVVSSNAAAEAAPSTGSTAFPVASVARATRALVSAAGSAGDSWLGNICGERGPSTHPLDPGPVFPLEVRYYNGSWLQHGSSSSSSSSSSSGSSSSSNDSSSSSNDNTSDYDSWWDATCVGALLRPFDRKRFRRSTGRGKAVLGVDLPFDRGKAWGRCSMEGDGLRAESEFLVLFGLCRERQENRVLETALVSCCSAHENHEEREYNIMILAAVQADLLFTTQHRPNSGRFGLLDFILDGCSRV